MDHDFFLLAKTEVGVASAGHIQPAEHEFDTPDLCSSTLPKSTFDKKNKTAYEIAERQDGLHCKCFPLFFSYEWMLKHSIVCPFREKRLGVFIEISYLTVIIDIKRYQELAS